MQLPSSHPCWVSAHLRSSTLMAGNSEKHRGNGPPSKLSRARPAQGFPLGHVQPGVGDSGSSLCRPSAVLRPVAM